jgi:hypothetical protein
MPDTLALGQDPAEPTTARIPPAPLSVRYAQAVLFLQGVIWAAGAIAGLIAQVGAVTGVLHGKPWALAVLAAGWSAFAASMATVKTLLAARLGCGRSRRVRKAVIAVELAMTCFGVLWFFEGAYSASGLPADMFTLAGLAGGVLSLAAALVLLGPRARQHAAGDAVRPEVTGPGPASGPASFWRPSALARA